MEVKNLESTKKFEYFGAKFEFKAYKNVLQKCENDDQNVDFDYGEEFLAIFLKVVHSHKSL